MSIKIFCNLQQKLYKAVIMIELFDTSMKIKKLGTAVSFAASILYAFILFTGKGWSPALFPALGIFVFGMFFFRLAALLVAEAQNKNHLSILYNDMDCRSFIASYEPILKRKELTGLQRLIVLNHLANAHAYAGDFDTATEILEKYEIPRTGRSVFNAMALVAGNLCSCFLLEGDTIKAEKKLNELEIIIKEAANTRSPLSGSFKRNSIIQKINLAILQGKKAEPDLLRRELEESSNRLNRLRIRLLLAQALRLDGQEDAVEEQLQKILGSGGDTVIQKQAHSMRGIEIRKNVSGTSAPQSKI